MNGVKINNIVKRSVSFSPTVNEWAEEMARARGQENNFSAFLAELIREARTRDKPVNSGAAGASDATLALAKVVNPLVSYSFPKSGSKPKATHPKASAGRRRKGAQNQQESSGSKHP